MKNKNDADVKGIHISVTNTEYIPTNLGSLFDLTYQYIYEPINVTSNDNVFTQTMIIQHIFDHDRKQETTLLSSWQKVF